MSRKSKDPNRRGFFNHLHTIRRAEKDKDAFCEAARITREPIPGLDRIILDPNKRHGAYGNYSYTNALRELRAMIEVMNAHELRMAEVAARTKNGGEDHAQSEPPGEAD